MPEPVTVVGGQVAGLVAADALARAGREVHLVLPTRGVGGGFLPLRRDGRRLELGVRLLELGYEDDHAPPPLADHVPGFGGHRPYTTLVRSWVTELVGDRLREVAPPRITLDGRSHDDVYFTVDLSPLPDILGPRQREEVAREAAQAAATLGDQGVLDDLGDLTLDEASRTNHGETFHRTLIAPVADKFLADGSARTLAAWRRKVWMPLFWPRTVVEACDGGPSFRPRRRFETVGDDGPGAVIEALLRRLRDATDVVIEPVGPLVEASPHGSEVELVIDGRAEPIRATRPILATGARELFGAVGHEYRVERARSVIAWLEVAMDEPLPLHHVVDEDNPVVRVSDSGPGARPRTRVLCVELRHDLAAERAPEAARRGLLDAGILDPVASAVPVFSGAMDTYDAPTAETRDAHAAALARLEATGLDALVVGGATAPGADAFNEQVVAGLAAAEARA
ncbi:NAD(P)-binding protein [Paraconexibacter sp.]|uniref:NAD(P)-binding protein n=1 Tax=Paraconexibacter sp. TaxID=2949640 RepID=UPI003567E724